MSAGGDDMERMRDLIKKRARSSGPLLLVGEPGVGKRFLARTIHKLSGRTGDFVAMSCEGISADQLETELFGCEKAALTGVAEKTGLIETTSGGTVFLEEIASVPLVLQWALMHLLETGVVLRLGATRPRPVHVRLICSTSQDLAHACANQTFRGDLFRTLRRFDLSVPPLRRRTDEIPKLVHTFIRDFRRPAARQIPLSVAPDAMDLLLRYWWPGNIGELKQVIARALRVCDGSVLTVEHLTVELRAALEQPRVPDEPRVPDDETAERPRGRDVMEILTRRALRRRTAVRRVLDTDAASRCSLCGEVEGAARTISGPRVFICDVCVEEAQRIVCAAAEPDGPPSPVPDDAAIAGYPEVSCAFCGKGARAVQHLVAGDKALICDACLDLCDDVLGERVTGEWPLGIEPRVMPRKTFSFRAVYAPATIDARIARAYDELDRDNPCQIVVLVSDGEAHAARRLLERLKTALADVAEFREHDARILRAALAAVALPRRRHHLDA